MSIEFAKNLYIDNDFYERYYKLANKKEISSCIFDLEKLEEYLIRVGLVGTPISNYYMNANAEYFDYDAYNFIINELLQDLLENVPMYDEHYFNFSKYKLELEELTSQINFINLRTGTVFFTARLFNAESYGWNNTFSIHINDKKNLIRLLNDILLAACHK